MSADTSIDLTLDDILAEVGDFGRYQAVTLLLLCFLNALVGTSTINYMISANTLHYRCKVPACEVGENIREIQYDQKWLHYAIPSSNGKFDSCTHYELNNRTTIEPGQCDADMFDTSKKVTCTEYVHASDERNIQTEFNIHCADNYKLAFVGTIGNLARLIFLPLAGLICDKFGRLPGMIIGTQLSGLFGIVKSFSVNYGMYITFEFLEAATYTCLFSGIYALGVEWLSIKHRVLGGTMLSVAYSLGGVIFGLVVMYVHDFRWIIRIFSIPATFVFVYFWLIPESVRWLLITGRIDRAVNILRSMAKFNRKQLSEKAIKTLKQEYLTEFLPEEESDDPDENLARQSVLQILWSISKSRALRLRFFICLYLWLACCFSYYGIALSSTQIPGANRYVSFILVFAMEVPANVLSQTLLSRFRRRPLLFIAICLAAVFILITPFIPKEISWAVLLLYVLGQASMAIGFTGLYMYTAELWPTNIRVTIMSICSMIGRIGSMVSPFPVILGSEYGPLPAILFGAVAFVASVLLLLNPETFEKKLPDTIEEAENL